MCWNEQVSLITFIIGIASSVILYRKGSNDKNNNVKAAAIAWGFIIFMQLFEALIHRDNGKCGTMGKIGAHGAFWDNILQPAAIIFSFWFIAHAKIKGPQILTLILLGVYLLIMMVNYFRKPFPCLKKGCNQIEFFWWNWSTVAAVLHHVCVLMGLIFFIQKDNGFRNFTTVLLYGLFALSVLFFYKKKLTIWCWFAAFAPIVTLAYLKLV